MILLSRVNNIGMENMASKPVIGLLGLGADATQFYQARLRAYNKDDAYDVITHDVDFDAINHHLPADFTRLKPLLRQALIGAPRCDALLIPNITLHETYDKISSANLGVPVIDLVEESLRCLLDNDITEISIIGSLYTSFSPYWTTHLQARAIKPVPIDQPLAKFMDGFRKRLYAGHQSHAEIEDFQDRLASFARSRPVLLACTELSFYVPKNTRQIFDAAEIHIHGALKQISNTFPETIAQKR